MKNSKEYPILFNSEMVRAILEGSKTQTRRPVKFKTRPDLPVSNITEHGPFKDQPDNTQSWSADHQGDGSIIVEQGIKCPHGLVGERLWVRETFTIETNFNLDPCDPPFNDGRPAKWTEDESYGKYWEQCHYRATDPVPSLNHEEDCAQCDSDGFCRKWKPSIHMPRWASRITLEITDVRIEHLNDIGSEGSQKEGFVYMRDFINTWNRIYGYDYRAWTCNPWVWVIGFKRVQ